ncbi:hypothetical protein A4A49_19966 [Nicotiana attenuata]|uniref:Uncharacterized protein n=1 Tax=Nicotiana attenuata TaxID=49451 RepID=A0A1J6KZ22_NICAT|nr:hypothetical protein A4A49_19966 [Nicotiana attenuata]
MTSPEDTSQVDSKLSSGLKPAKLSKKLEKTVNGKEGKRQRVISRRYCRCQANAGGQIWREAEEVSGSKGQEE